jgi:hypothetical protein
MRRFGRLSGLGVLLFIACGGTKPAPPPKSAPASNALAKEPSDKPDLSPVAAPAELFLVGRVKRPGPILDTLGNWAGLPGSLRTLVGQELHGLGSLMAWDAPIEVAVALPARGRRNDVRAVVSVGLNSVGGMVNAARERGFSPERILPEVFGFAGPNGVSCVVGPSLGSSSARLVCGDRAGEVEELFAYATRGLPNENLGDRDLELELRAEPLRRRYSSEIAGARLFAGFLLRQLEMDHPRLDRALSDAAYGVVDELVLEVEDTDSIKLGGVLDDTNKNVSLEIAWKFRGTRSWLARYASELSRRPAPAPPAFARLPGNALGASYAVDFGTEKSAPLRASVLDLIDAYLEHERAEKDTRERARRFFTDLMHVMGTSYVQASGNFEPSALASEAAKKVGFRISRSEVKAADFERLFAEFDALVGDRKFWNLVAKRFDLDPKAPPKTRLVPLRGKGLPAGARALVITIPPSLVEKIQKGTTSRLKLETKEPIRFVAAVCADGPQASVLVTSFDEKDAAERLRAYFAEGGQRLGQRADLEPLRSGRALQAEFFTLQKFVDSLGGGGAEKGGARLPNRGETPIFSNYTAAPGPPLTLSASVTVPAAAIADLPGIGADLLSSF